MADIIPCACGNPIPCNLQSTVITDVPCNPVPLPANRKCYCDGHCRCSPCGYPRDLTGYYNPLYGGEICSLQELFLRAAKTAGVVVSVLACTEREIAEARGERRLYVDASGIGFVLMSREWLDTMRKGQHCCV